MYRYITVLYSLKLLDEGLATEGVTAAGLVGLALLITFFGYFEEKTRRFN